MPSQPTYAVFVDTLTPDKGAWEVGDVVGVVVRVRRKAYAGGQHGDGPPRASYPAIWGTTREQNHVAFPVPQVEPSEIDLEAVHVDPGENTQTLPLRNTTRVEDEDGGYRWYGEVQVTEAGKHSISIIAQVGGAIVTEITSFRVRDTVGSSLYGSLGPAPEDAVPVHVAMDIDRPDSGQWEIYNDVGVFITLRGYDRSHKTRGGKSAIGVELNPRITDLNVEVELIYPSGASEYLPVQDAVHPSDEANWHKMRADDASPDAAQVVFTPLVPGTYRLRAYALGAKEDTTFVGAEEVGVRILDRIPAVAAARLGWIVRGRGIPKLFRVEKDNALTIVSGG